MKIKATVIFIANILLIIAIGILICWNIVSKLWNEYLILQLIVVTIEIISFILSIKLLKISYKDYVSQNRKFMATKKLNNEELQMIIDAKELIKSVDSSIKISGFNVYKVHFIKSGWFNYDEKTKERSVFIPFKKFMKMNKEFCFMAIVHEILHSQNLRDNIEIFTDEFLEGLNQFFTNWLIENYSQGYKIPEKINVMSIELKENIVEIQGKYRVYYKEVQEVEKILEKSKIDIKELFMNYINFKPEIWRQFVPKYYIK